MDGKKEDEAYRGERRGTIRVKTEDRRGDESESLPYTSILACKMVLFAQVEFKTMLQIVLFCWRMIMG